MLGLLAILFLVGVYILYAGKFAFSQKRKLDKPYAAYVGMALILLAALPFVLPLVDDIFIIIGLAATILTTAFFLSEKISQDEK